jgi:uncharacterized repeat protein (TIGR02059 family)
LTISGATYYIDPSGSDSNSGSSSSPWKTLAYACSKVTTSGDIIFVNSGTYNEISRCVLAVGVSIVGQGVTSIIKSSYVATGKNDGAIYLNSGSGASTNGNQSISYIELDGNSLTSTRAITINFRNNVEIHHCTFTNFYYSAINFNGTTNGYPTSSSTYHSTGNSMHDCTILNCSKSINGDGGINGQYGELMMAGQDGLLVYNNTFDDTGIPTNYMGDTWNSMYLKNTKLYNNVLSRNNDTAPWNFFSEMFFTEGGLEIYGNTFNGNSTLDIVDVRPGGSGFGCKIYSNTWTNPTQQPINSHGIQSIDLEERGAIQYCYIYNNHFKNTNAGILFDGLASNVDKTLVGGNISMDHIYVYYNIFENVGNTTNNYSSAINIKSESSSGGGSLIWDNIYIDNNTIISGITNKMHSGILTETGGTMTNLYFRNNIIQGAVSYPIIFSYNLSGSVATVYSQKNLYYQNATNAIGYSGVTVSGLTEAAVSSANPLFVSASDFHLQPTSPALGTGISITNPSIITDCEGSAINNPPDIGAYKSGSTVSQPVVPVYQSSAVANTTPSILEMTYNLTLANIVPATSAFSVLVNSAARSVSAVTVSGTKIQLTLSTRILPGNVVTVSYIKPANNPLETNSGGIASSITAQPVNNNCINVAPTAVITSPAINSSFTSPANISITANAIDNDGSVSLVEFYNGNTKLGSSSASPYSFTWNNVTAGNYSLTIIATDNLSAKTTSSAISISVINNISAPNMHPVVKILNPRKGNAYANLSSVEIDATASDPDGTISKVEFYNGKVKLVELTSAPYTYIWKDVAAGNYSITAVATDNLNDTTLSSPVEFVVGAITKYDGNSDVVKLFPNPNNGHFSIEFINPLQSEKNEIIITDMAGKQVYDGSVLKEDIAKQFDLSNSKSGLYVMMIKDKEILVTKKFIIK